VVLSTSDDIRELPERVRVYPNPSAGQVNFRIPYTGKIQIEFFNSLGEIVYKESFYNSMKDFSVDLRQHGIQSGVFLYRIGYEQKFETGKILIK